MFQMSQAKLCVCGVQTGGTKTKVYDSRGKKKHIAYGLIGSCVAARSNKVKGEKSAVVQRIVLS